MQQTPVKRDTSDWLSVLLHLGVRVKVATVWAPIFAEVIGPDTFSMGEHELDDFLGQILHESLGLEKLEEDLYYTTTDRLMQVWPTRFKTAADARPYLRSPEALANRVYGGRLGNTKPGDGWRHRGSGLIQVTGADNYRAVQKATGIPVYDHPELLRVASAENLRCCIAWWEGNVPDGVMNCVPCVTKKVNGGKHGLAERERLTAEAGKRLA